ncbi:hypothetical protein BKK48_06255 [Rodentibacter heidelbergensis]|uniref:Uncharacterized protein n=1 Tax=Rodentibacter heidelbergensis TaxID=1908258 RepID=A0A1V3I8L6_9PAST|nr:hypothetical protein BKK48_06255 [Rodentibacter heidelbergensis]
MDLSSFLKNLSLSFVQRKSHDFFFIKHGIKNSGQSHDDPNNGYANPKTLPMFLDFNFLSLISF